MLTVQGLPGEILAALACLRHSLNTRVSFYVDGFNLYHLRLKEQRCFRWLNLRVLAEALSRREIKNLTVNYYTARVSAKIDKDAPARQHLYLSALASEPAVNIHYGNFLFGEKMAFLSNPPDTVPKAYAWTTPLPRLVKVAKVEEKGSDVNLASHLVRDALLDRFDEAFVISNDTDLIEPIRIVTQEVGKPVGIVAPRRQRKGSAPIPSPSLQKVSTFVVHIDDHQLAAAQFPDRIELANGKSIRKPFGWT